MGAAAWLPGSGQSEQTAEKTGKHLKTAESRVRGKMDGLTFPAITGRHVGEALIDEVFKPPVSHHPPRYKWPQKGRRGHAIDRARPCHEM